VATTPDVHGFRDMRRRTALLMILLTGSTPLACGAMSPPAADRQAELARLLRDDCGACHGLTRKGGLGAALTPAAIAGKADEGLVNVILNGLPGTAMPPWGQFLSENDARWLVAQLRNGTHFGTNRESAP
jgi:cytochrome c55X